MTKTDKLAKASSGFLLLVAITISEAQAAPPIDSYSPTHDIPRIDALKPGIYSVRPGAVFTSGAVYTINGLGFGDQPGDIALVTGKKHKLSNCTFDGDRIVLSRKSWRDDQIVAQMPDVLPMGSSVCTLNLEVVTASMGGATARYHLSATLSPPQISNP